LKILISLVVTHEMNKNVILINDVRVVMMSLKTEILKMVREGKINLAKSKAEDVKLSKEEIKEIFLKLKGKKVKLSTYRYVVNYPGSPVPKYRIGYTLEGTLEGKRYTIDFKLERGKVVIYSVSQT